MNKVCKKIAMPVVAGIILSGCATTREEPIDGDRGFDVSVESSENRVLGSRGIIPQPYDEPQDFEVVMVDKIPADIAGPIVLPDIDTPAEDNKAGGIDEPTPEPPKEVERIKYVVKKGDSFWRVANMYGVSSKNLARINNLPLDKPLKLGITLEIPEGGKLRAVAPRKESSTPKKSSSSATKTQKSGSKAVGDYRPRGKQAIPADGKYAVQSGDSLWKVSNRFGVTSNEIREWNSLKSDKLFIGQVLVLKKGTAATPVVEKTPTPKVEEVVTPVAPVVENNSGSLNTPINPVDDKVEAAPVVQVAPVVEKVEPVADVEIVEHTVGVNETLQDIAELLMVDDLEKIKKANPGIDCNNLKAGQVIKVPVDL